jgi:hypothetical protein
MKYWFRLCGNGTEWDDANIAPRQACNTIITNFRIEAPKNDRSVRSTAHFHADQGVHFKSAICGQEYGHMGGKLAIEGGGRRIVNQFVERPP